VEPKLSAQQQKGVRGMEQFRWSPNAQPATVGVWIWAWLKHGQPGSNHNLATDNPTF